MYEAIFLAQVSPAHGKYLTEICKHANSALKEKKRKERLKSRSEKENLRYIGIKIHDIDW